MATSREQIAQSPSKYSVGFGWTALMFE
jgi:hypothetical protein